MFWVLYQLSCTHCQHSSQLICHFPSEVHIWSSLAFVWITQKIRLEAENRIVKTIENNFVPSLAKNEIWHWYFIFESSPEGSLATLSDSLFDLSSDTWHRPDLCPDIAGHFDGRVEHSFDKGSIFHDFIRLANQLDFFQNLCQIKNTSKALFI